MERAASGRPAGCVEECPGCRHRDFSREESLGQKENWARAQVGELGPVAPIRAVEERWGYRRKVVLHARLVAGYWAFGLVRWRRGEEHFIPIPGCPVQSEGVNAILGAARRLPDSLPLAYVQISGRALTLVLKRARDEGLLAALKKMEPELQASGAEALWVNWHPAAGRRVISSRHMERVFGDIALWDGSCWHGPLAFRQQIPALEDEAQALAAAHFGKAARVLDLYSGLGLSLRRWVENGAESMGVELVGESCVLAERNAAGARLLRGRVEDRLPQLDPFARAGAFAVYTNPPRGGHGTVANEWLKNSGAEKIAYLSCNMRSLADDLRGLRAKYRVIQIQPFDFFPQTDHVEALALLTRTDLLFT